MGSLIRVRGVDCGRVHRPWSRRALDPVSALQSSGQNDKADKNSDNGSGSGEELHLFHDRRGPVDFFDIPIRYGSGATRIVEDEIVRARLAGDALPSRAPEFLSAGADPRVDAYAWAW
jgi:hypothetical protein